MIDAVDRGGRLNLIETGTGLEDTVQFAGTIQVTRLGLPVHPEVSVYILAKHV